MGRFFNRQRDEEKRRRLRHDAVPAEVLFWQQVRNRQLGGFKFRRQHGIAHYVADFCCPECLLIVELDGASHDGEDAVAYDLNRQHYLESLGFQVVRFTNAQVYRQMPQVLENLLQLCEARRAFTPHPRPLSP